MRIVFFGSPAAALPSLDKLLAAGHEVPLVVTRPDHPAGRGRRLTSCPVKKYAAERGIPSYEPERIRKTPEALDRLREARADIHIVVAYGQIMPGPIINLPRRRSLNVHFSLLPKYRGASPVAWAILNGETVTGVTIFRLDEKMDEGDIFGSAEEAIHPDDTAGRLESRLAVSGADLLVQTLERLDAIIPRPQDHAQATLAPKLKKESGLIDWGADAAAVDRLVRAMQPWPTAFTFLRGERFILLEGRPAGADDDRDASRSIAAPAGTILEAGKSGIRVLCGSGTSYRVSRLQAGGKKPMDAAAFLRGAMVAPGDILGKNAER